MNYDNLISKLPPIAREPFRQMYSNLGNWNGVVGRCNYTVQFFIAIILNVAMCVVSCILQWIPGIGSYLYYLCSFLSIVFVGIPFLRIVIMRCRDAGWPVWAPFAGLACCCCGIAVVEVVLLFKESLYGTDDDYNQPYNNQPQQYNNQQQYNYNQGQAYNQQFQQPQPYNQQFQQPQPYNQQFQQPQPYNQQQSNNQQQSISLMKNNNQNITPQDDDEEF